MAPSFLVGSKDQCLGILEILPIKRRGKRRNHRWSFVWKIRGNTSQQRWRCYPPLLSQRKRERRPLLDFRFQISVEVWRVAGCPHPGSFAAGLRLGWLYQLMWCRIQTCAVVGGMWRCRPGHLKWRRTASGCSQRWHHREVWWLRTLAWFKYHVDPRKEQTFFTTKKSSFSTILAKGCFTNWCQRYPNAKVVTRWHNTCQVNRLRKMAPVDTLGTIAVRCKHCHLRVWDVTCLASEAHKTKPHESSVEFIDLDGSHMFDHDFHMSFNFLCSICAWPWKLQTMKQHEKM